MRIQPRPGNPYGFIFIGTVSVTNLSIRIYNSYVQYNNGMTVQPRGKSTMTYNAYGMFPGPNI